MTSPVVTDTSPEIAEPALRFLSGGGEATRLILARNWSDHVLGEPAHWPEALKVALSLVLNSPESMILAWGREALTFFFNETYIPLLGPRVTWAMGAPFTTVWADAWEQAKPIIDEAFAGRSRRFVDLPWKLGTDRGEKDTWWSFSYSRVLDSAGAVAGLFIFTNETTARVLADEAVRESQRRLAVEVERQRLSLQQMPGFIGILAGVDHVFEYVNDAYVAISGSRDFVGRSIREVFPDLEGQGFFERLDRAYTTGEAFNGRAVPIRLAGEETERFIDHHYQPLRDEHGTVTGIFVGGYEVTEGVRAGHRREALLRLDELLRDVADAAELSVAAAALLGRTLGVPRVGYGTLDPEAGTISVERNWSAPGWPTLVGVHRFDAYGSYFAELKRGVPVVNTNVEADPRTASSVATFQALGVRAFIDVPVMENGHAVAQFFVHSPQPRAWTAEDVALVRDFAERTRTAMARRHAEQALRGHAETLETRVAERTRDLEAVHEQLRQSQKMEAVGQLTGGLAHDFNNLLAGISGSLELMAARMAQGRTAEVDKYVTAAQGAARRAAALTHRLLAFSRRQTLDPKPIDVNTLTAGMADLIRRAVGPAIDVEIVAAVGLWTALVDPPQLENALLNLCLNARDAMPDGGKITIETANRWLDRATSRRHDMPEGQYLSLCVTDTGTGMSADVLAKAFDPFFTTKPIGEGTGLGLSMIYGFAKQSGGQVRIHSALGRGTTVCLYLPRFHGEMRESEAMTAVADAARAQQGETVLVVDDEPSVRMLVADVLEDLGYTAIEAGDSVAGLKILQSDVRLDLLITDVGLPGGLNGRQMADAARSLRPDLKVLFITGYAENALLGEGQLAPGMAVLTKPFGIDVLGARIREMIQG